MRPIPFYTNTQDNTHCFQAGLRMVLKHFLPDREFSWGELEEMTAKKEGLWTWQLQGILNLKAMGFEVVDIDAFDYRAFIERGGDYLIENYGEEVGQSQIEHSDIAQEQVLAKRYIPLDVHQQRTPDFTDLESYLKDGYLVTCNVNSHALYDEPGYAGHFVVVYGYENGIVHFHDPGLPPHPNSQMTTEQFRKGWENGYEHAKNMVAIKLKG